MRVRRLLRLAFKELGYRDEKEIDWKIGGIMMKMAGEFEESVKGKKFKNPETGNEVQFGSLPAEEQKKLRSRYDKKSEVLEEVSSKETKSKIKEGLKKFVNAKDFSAFGSALKSGDRAVMKKSIPGMVKGVAKVVGSILLGVFLLKSNSKEEGGELSGEEEEKLVEVSKEVSKEVISETVSKADEEFDKKEESDEEEDEESDEEEDEDEDEDEEEDEGEDEEEDEGDFKEEVKKYRAKGTKKEKEVFDKIVAFEKGYEEEIKKKESDKKKLKEKLDAWEDKYDSNLKKMSDKDWEDYNEMGKKLKKEYGEVKNDLSYFKSKAEEDIENFIRKEHDAYRIESLKLEDDEEGLEKFKEENKVIVEYLKKKLKGHVKFGGDKFMDSFIEDIQEKIKEKIRDIF